jgi:hypothetical protein
MNIENKASGGKKRAPTVWLVILGLFFIGHTAALYIPAFAGQSPIGRVEMAASSLLGALLWPTLIGVVIQKIKGGRKWLGAIIGLILGYLVLQGSYFVAAANGWAPNSQSNDQEANTDPANLIAAELESLNRNLPLMVDEGLRLNSYEGEGNVLVMNLTTVGILAEEIDVVSWMGATEHEIAAGVCSNPEYRQILEAGVIYEYRYRDEVGAPVVSTRIAETDCE